MAHSLVKVFIHYVWTTKHRERTLAGDTRRVVKDHLDTYAHQSRIEIAALDVQPEHVHALVRLSPDQRIEDVAKLLKGESSHWINQSDLLRGKFSWQTGYAALSVSYDRIGAVKKYIETQDEHHRKKSFDEEFRGMLKEVGYTDQEVEDLLGM